MNKVEYKYLKDLCSVNQGLQIPISERYSEDGKNRYFYITVQFLKDGHREKYYVENPPTSSICKEDDIIVVRTGSTGQVLTGITGCFHNNFFKVNYDKSKVLGKYLYYCLKSPEKQKEMQQRAGITTIPDLNHFMFLDMKIPYFNIEKQREIVQILDLLNNKIEVNNKINTELEAMAKTLYDYWFVQFDFPDKNGKPYKSSGGKMVWNEELKREIPEGWVVEELGNELNVQRGISYKSSEIKTEDGIPMINLNSFNLDGTYKHEGIKIYSGKYADKNIVKSGDLLIAVTDVTRNADIIGKSIIVPDYYKEAVISMDIAKIIPIGNLTESYLMMLFNSKHYHNYIKWFASGTIVLHLNLDGMNWYKAEIPPKELLNKFDDVYKPLAKRINETKKQNQELASLRDWLLPMLMNGQVTVGEVEEELGVVAEGSVGYKKS